MTPIPLKQFLQDHRGMILLDADRPIPPSMLDLVLRKGQRLVLAAEGKALAAVVCLDDLSLLEMTDHGVEPLSMVLD